MNDGFARGGGRAGAAAALLALVLTTAAFGAPPPQPDERLDVAIAALTHVRESLPPGQVVVDPRPLCVARLYGWACPPPLVTLARELGLTFGSREFSYVCLNGDRECRLMGAEVLVELLEPRVRPRDATMGVNVWWRTGRGAAVGERRTVLTLERGARGWEVTGESARVPGGEELEADDEERRPVDDGRLDR